MGKVQHSTNNMLTPQLFSSRHSYILYEGLDPFDKNIVDILTRGETYEIPVGELFETYERLNNNSSMMRRRRETMKVNQV